MGLDMYLTGRTELWGSGKAKDADGYKIDAVEVELAYWRKHPNLHGYIVETFAGGVDDCRPVLLDEDAILRILRAVENDELPHTEGFFFGTSEKSAAQMAEDVAVFEAALIWLKTERPNEIRSLRYEASW
jgi:hypothetical protein